MNYKNFTRLIYQKIRELLIIIPIPSKNLFCFFFNLFSFFINSDVTIYYKNNFYYLKNRRWRFSYRKAGVYFYLFGFKKRIEYLKKTYLIKDLVFKKNDVIIDCGANNGDFALCFSNNINYFGIEPSPIVFSNLKYNLKKKNLFNFALWNVEKTMKFYLKDEGGDSSIIKTDNYTQKISVRTKTLDQLINKINKKIKLIKIEAEGAEPEILYGLRKKISKVEYLTIDGGYERGVNNLSTIDKCKKFLIKNNFEMVDFNNKRYVGLFRNKLYF